MASSSAGPSTNGLVQPHFIPAAHDHGMPVPTAAGLLAVVGVFDIAGTVLSGWLTDRTDPRAPVVFGWVFAAHQGGSAFAAFGGGVIRDVTGSYDLAWLVAGAACIAAAAMSISIRRTPRPSDPGTVPPTRPEEAAAAGSHG